MSRTDPAGTPLGDAFHVFDTTLRDGAQREGICYSVADKLAVARQLDALGVGFIEGGWPGALPKDTEFFARAAAGELTLRHAALVAFGATRKAGHDRRPTTPRSGPCWTRRRRSSRSSRSPTARHIERALRTDVDENCAMVADTVAFLRGEGRRVFLDAEHFFDGYRFDPDTALRVLDAAVTAGADVAVLCDTNGGMLPLGIAEVVTEVARPHRLPARHPLPGRHRAARSPTPSPRCRRARRTSSAPPTATASGPATPTCSPSSGTS